jgi:serine/threonine protein kinase
LPKRKEGILKIVGTPEYMPPDTLFGYGYGVASEWWTLGCLIYEMLTGNPPFRLQEERLGKQNARE